MQRKTASFCCQRKSKPESQIAGLFIYLFLTNDQKLKYFFLYYKIKYFKSSVVDTTLAQKFQNKILVVSC